MPLWRNIYDLHVSAHRLRHLKPVQHECETLKGPLSRVGCRVPRIRNLSQGKFDEKLQRSQDSLPKTNGAIGWVSARLWRISPLQYNFQPQAQSLRERHPRFDRLTPGKLHPVHWRWWNGSFHLLWRPWVLGRSLIERLNSQLPFVLFARYTLL